MTLVLGIETSCDETSVAVVADGRGVRANLVASQFDLHARYGGVVPEIASRAHIERLDGLILSALEQAGVAPAEIDAIAVTHTPGLIGALLIGVTAAKSLAWAWGRPVIGVNHIHAHATSAAIAGPDDVWPAVALVVSGGHSSLFHVRGFTDIDLMGCTTDDAAGEAFDKVASMLGLGFPGGPALQRAAERGDPRRFRLPRPLLDDPARLDFSFSGLKTSVRYQLFGAGRPDMDAATLDPQVVADMAAGVQEAIIDCLVGKSLLALERTGFRRLSVGGGVAANRPFRERLERLAAERGFELHIPPLSLCTDNAVMGAIAVERINAGQFAGLDLDIEAGLDRVA